MEPLNSEIRLLKYSRQNLSCFNGKQAIVGFVEIKLMNDKE
jgi:hypothetical protein